MINKLWDPRMRSAILAHLASGGVRLDPFVLKTVENLRASPR
jgi:formate dehydrogenase subunit delta